MLLNLSHNEAAVVVTHNMCDVNVSTCCCPLDYC